jgi:hypothetical protein
MNKELDFFKESKQNKQGYSSTRLEDFSYDNLEFFRNVILMYDKIPIKGLTVEYILENDWFNAIDEHLFNILKEQYGDDIEYKKGAEVIHFNIAGINFRFINEDAIED